MFAELARRAALNMGSHIDAPEMYLRLALKVQGQARATAESIAEIKHPRAVAFVGQTNVSGLMQVNNSTGAEEKARASAGGRGKSVESSKRTIGSERWLDRGTAGTAKRGDPIGGNRGLARRDRDLRRARPRVRQTRCGMGYGRGSCGKNCDGFGTT